MLYYEFREYLEENAAPALKIFRNKIEEIENSRNSRRKVHKRWNEIQINRAVEHEVDKLIDNAYEKIKAQKGVPKYNGKEIWIEFMNEHNFLDMFSDGVNEMEFE
ncbi:TPA: hypothetical protein ACU1XM_002332 [Enterococcus faecalis]|nr:hypothetical protein T481_14235 [Enterococcus faecalis PF3]